LGKAEAQEGRMTDPAILIDTIEKPRMMPGLFVGEPSDQ
jgi:hypothetical protein